MALMQVAREETERQLAELRSIRDAIASGQMTVGETISGPCTSARLAEIEQKIAEIERLLDKELLNS